jgi:hypothetical protein
MLKPQRTPPERREWLSAVSYGVILVVPFFLPGRACNLGRKRVGLLRRLEIIG